jgi:hypothetical protein
VTLTPQQQGAIAVTNPDGTWLMSGSDGSGGKSAEAQGARKVANPDGTKVGS